MPSMIDIIKRAYRLSPRESPPTAAQTPAPPRVTRNEAVCKGLTQSDIDAMWEESRNQSVMDWKVGLTWVSPGLSGRRTNISQRCLDYYSAGAAKIEGAEDSLTAHTRADLEAWGSVIQGLTKSTVWAQEWVNGIPTDLPDVYMMRYAKDEALSFAGALQQVAAILDLPQNEAQERFSVELRGRKYDPEEVAAGEALRVLKVGGTVDRHIEGYGRGNNAKTYIHQYFKASLQQDYLQTQQRVTDSTGYDSGWRAGGSVKSGVFNEIFSALEETIPGLKTGAPVTNKEVLGALVSLMASMHPPELAPIINGVYGFTVPPLETQAKAPTPPGTHPLIAAIPYFATRIYLEKTKEATINEHIATTYGMLKDYEEGKILLPLDDLNARAREALADVKRTDETDSGSYQYPVDAYAMKHLGRSSYEEAQFQAMRAQLVAAGGYYLPENDLADGPDLIFRREDIVLDPSEQAQLDRAKGAIQARYTRIAEVLSKWDYEKHPRLPTEQEWAAAGVPSPGTAVSDLLLAQALEERDKTRAAVDLAGAEARETATTAHQSRMTALAQSTLAQIQALEGSVVMDREAYAQSKAQILGDAQARIDAAEGRFVQARGEALAALEGKARRLEKIAPPTGIQHLLQCKELLDQATTATSPEDVYPALAQVADLLDQVEADIEDVAAADRRRREDAQLLTGAREELSKALVQAAEGLRAMTNGAAVAAQVAADDARQAHLRAQQQTQAAADAVARLQAQAATFRLAAVPVAPDGTVSSGSAQAAARALQTLQVSMPSMADLSAQIAAARSAAGASENPSTLQMIALRSRADELEAQVSAAMQAMQAAYDAEIAAARAANQARITAVKTSDEAALAAAGGAEAKAAAGLTGKEVGIGAAVVAAKFLIH
jgi:hypothetical protein